MKVRIHGFGMQAEMEAVPRKGEYVQAADATGNIVWRRVIAVAWEPWGEEPKVHVEISMS
jgi:hypothetical protein